MFVRVADWLLTTSALAYGTAVSVTSLPGTSDLFTIVKEYGPWVGLILWFVWRDQQREKRMVDEVLSLHKYQRDVLTEAVRATSKAIQRNADLLEQVGSLPCVKDKEVRS